MSRVARPLLLCLLLLLPAAARAQQTYEASPDLIGAGGYVVFYDARGPLSFVPMTRRELPHDVSIGGEVHARACSYGISILVPLSANLVRLSGAYGMAGYEDVLAKIRRDSPELGGVFDVRVDDHTTSILGLFRRACTEVVARGFRFTGTP